MNKLKQIKQMPTTHDNVHESIYRSHAAIELVKYMLNRGDSNESILMVIEDIYDGISESEIKDTAGSLKKMVEKPHPLIEKELTQQWDKDKILPELQPPFKPSCNHTTTV